MKKITVALLLLMSMLMILCAGCGSGETAEEAAVSATMAPVEETVEETAPEAEAEPVEEATEPEGEEEPAGEEDAYEVAMGMTGAPVADLFAAIGEPNGSEYTASCLIPTGEDGLLYYDDFTVSTIKYADGTELVMGAY